MIESDESVSVLCVGFVFLALLEFTVVNYMWRKECCQNFRRAKSERGLGAYGQNINMGSTGKSPSIGRLSVMTIFCI